MKLVVDTNIMFTYFWKNSFSRIILTSSDLKLFSPEYALEELMEHKEEIKEKKNLSEAEFEGFLEGLREHVKFISFENYSDFLNDASEIPDKKDIDFMALALKFGIPVWTNDVHFKKQSLVRVFTTSELVNELEK